MTRFKLNSVSLDGKHPEIQSRLERTEFSPPLFHKNTVTEACVQRRCAEEELHCLQWLI